MEYKTEMIDTAKLNKNQKEAVLSDDKYLRIIAGAGSGKTRVLTMRIVHLIEDEDVWPNRILAITFTNKAANEMKNRIRKMLENEEGGTPWISTIHSLCVRILREDIGVMGYPKNFTIMDADDQKSIVKDAVKQLDIGECGVTPNEFINYISNNKSAEIDADTAKKIAGNFSDDKYKAQVYAWYLERQKSMYALDFDDLILWTVRMFSRFEEVKSKWQRRFHYILVDEFQDIDRLQYKLIRQLAGQDSSIYVVGDPDQTIYTWRGADVDIIMHFEKDFPSAKTVILNQNYRSTGPILAAANSVIANNRNRMKKELFTENKSEEKVTHYAAASDEYEAAWIAGKIFELHRKGARYSDIAILYRSNYLSRSLEKGLIDQRIPYIIYGGIRFYERQEVKDILCYLRMCTSADDLALQRILNRPKRGIGTKTMDNISNAAREQGISMYEVCKQGKIFSGKAKKTIAEFTDMVETWRGKLNGGKTDIADLFQEITEDSGYKHMLDMDKEKGQERLENMKSVLDDLRNFMDENEDATLDDYLQQVTLYTDRDEAENQDCVQMMTVHAAKGLEFDTVFVSDMNEGIFPNERAVNESGRKGMEEERRLAYVAFTRAKKKLYLTEAGGFSFILQRVRTTSRFIEEIDPKYLENTGGSQHRASDDYRGSSRRSVEISSHLDTAAMPVAESFEHRMKRQNKGTVLAKGEQVVHSKFGEGIVIDCKNGIASIAFSYPYGVKKIAAGHPSLKKKQ
jgi:DNA helicase-2/ATP-dependent DNA helicase PcrA